jgi:hypothetical protein
MLNLKRLLTHCTMLGQTTSLQCTQLWVKHLQIRQEYYRTNYSASTLILPISLVQNWGIYHVVGRELYLLITISLLLHLYIILFRVLLKFRKILKFSHCWILIWQPNCTNNQQIRERRLNLKTSFVTKSNTLFPNYNKNIK